MRGGGAEGWGEGLGRRQLVHYVHGTLRSRLPHMSVIHFVQILFRPVSRSIQPSRVILVHTYSERCTAHSPGASDWLLCSTLDPHVLHAGRIQQEEPGVRGDGCEGASCMLGESSKMNQVGCMHSCVGVCVYSFVRVKEVEVGSGGRGTRGGRRPNTPVASVWLREHPAESRELLDLSVRPAPPPHTDCRLWLAPRPPR